MSTKPTLLAVALAAVMTPAIATAAPLTVYGKVNLEVGYNDFDADSKSDDAETEVRSNSSRVGFKGDMEVAHGLTAFYTVEYQVNVNADSDDDDFDSRNQFVGLKGDFGAVVLGRNDTMLKKSQGKVDVFSDYQGDLKNYGLKGDNRGSETVSYMLPKYGLFSAGVTYIAEGAEKQVDEDDKVTDGFSVGAMYGDAKYKKANYYFALAYDSDVAGMDNILRATAGTKVAGIKLGALYQQQEAYGGDSKDGFLVSAAYDINDWTLKAQYVDMEDTADGFTVGADYKLAKTTKLFAYYTDRSYDDDQNGKAGSFAGVGVEHKF